MARDQVFISYSHADKEWLIRLQTILIPLQRQGTLKVWADTDIRPGQLWKEEIKQALAKAKVAVLLVSPDFLASRFIYENELPPLLNAAENEGLTILWVSVRPSLYLETVIGEYQAAYDPKTPLSTLPVWQQEVALTEIAQTIKSTWPTEIPVPPPCVEPKPSASPTRSTLPAIQYIHGWSAQQVQDLQRQTALALGLMVEFRDTLKDGSQGPLMVVIPGGRFLMGSPRGEPGRCDDERQHKVEVTPFAIGKYAVTFEEYDRFAEATEHDKPSDRGWGRGRRPVLVGWNDAVAYTEWLSQQTGRAYRFPTEAEWEYACRAGTTTAYHFGASINPALANYHRIIDINRFFTRLEAVFITGEAFKGLITGKRVGEEKTVEVGHYPANAWGLHEMHCNVEEWTCSVYDGDYGGSEQHCAESSGTDSRCAVRRGGLWHNAPRDLRAAARHVGDIFLLTSYAAAAAGFRLARTFP